MEDTFKIRSYGFQELATLYLPHIQPRSASNRLRAWINRNEKLKRDLLLLGYVKSGKILTPAMVKVIVDAIGCP
jgi:hypothetical protein